VFTGGTLSTQPITHPEGDYFKNYFMNFSSDGLYIFM